MVCLYKIIHNPSLISIFHQMGFFLGKSKTEVEFNEICRVHESLKVKYQSTLYDSRCIIFNANTEDTLQITPPSNFRSQAIYYASESDPNVDLENQVTEFLSSLFWILESKRMERSREKVHIEIIDHRYPITKLYSFIILF